MKILVVDDSALSRETMKRAVISAGHECLLADDGSSAWELLQRERIDVVLSDWEMQELDGIALCARIRALPKRDEYIYFILMTGTRDQSRYINAMAAGADDFLVKPVDRTELNGRLLAAERVTALHRLLSEQRAELMRLNERYYAESRIDSLTQVGNRLRLDEDLANIAAQVQRYGHSFAIALCDIDFFKPYNDNYGHLEGDKVLSAVARSLRGGCRAGDAVYRYGGEEFLMLLPLQSESGAVQAMSRQRADLRALAIEHGHSPFKTVTFSAGISFMAPNSTKATSALLTEADHALYFAKQRGRNCTAVYRATSPELVVDPPVEDRK